PLCHRTPPELLPSYFGLPPEGSLVPVPALALCRRSQKGAFQSRRAPEPEPVEERRGWTPPVHPAVMFSPLLGLSPAQVGLRRGFSCASFWLLEGLTGGGFFVFVVVINLFRFLFFPP